MMENVKNVDSRYPRPADAEFMKYGTAGFRDKAAKLTHVMARCGAVAVVASLQAECKHVGLMITASHNPAPDNGVKLVDFDGAMVKPCVEKIAIDLINSSSFENDVQAKLDELKATPEALSKVTVVIGRDTRESSPRFSTSACEMIEALGAKVVDLGIVTTPMLHFGVWHQNEFGVVGTPEVYFKYFEERLKEAYDGTGCAPSKLVFDGACGVGAIHGPSFAPALKSLNIDMQIINTPEEGVLNSGCGSDFVQTSQGSPNNCEYPEARCCSVDGDADRIVYHYTESSGKFHLIDGDKIAALYLKVINEFILACGAAKADIKPLSVAIVQTAYANGASTIAMQKTIDDTSSMAQLPDVNVEIRCAKTGVKNLHHIAEDYDIGVYFEANGHGTVIFDKKAVEAWGASRGITENPQFKKLMSFLTLFNASVGDAFTDMMACEAGLKILGMDVAQWSAMYTGLPCSQSKVYLPKEQMSLIKPHPDHERWLVSPEDVQTAIDAEVKPYPICRAFVRPSGTEPLVRLYVEAEKTEDRDLVVKNLTKLLTERFK